MAFSNSSKPWDFDNYFPHSSEKQGQADECIRRFKVDALRAYVSKLHGGIDCALEQQFMTQGGKYIVRVLRFRDGKTRWAVRVPVQKPTEASWLRSEVAAMMLVRERTRIPVPKVLGYRDDGDSVGNPIGVAFMSAEFFPFKAAIHLDGGFYNHHGCVPRERRRHFYDQVAEIQV
jgi:hypothetical protein